MAQVGAAKATATPLTLACLPCPASLFPVACRCAAPGVAPEASVPDPSLQPAPALQPALTLLPALHDLTTEQQQAALLAWWPEDTPEAVYKHAVVLQLFNTPYGCKGDDTPYSMDLGLAVNHGVPGPAKDYFHATGKAPKPLLEADSLFLMQVSRMPGRLLAVQCPS